MEPMNPPGQSGFFWKSGIITALVTMGLFLLIYYTGDVLLVWVRLPLSLVSVGLILTGVIIQGKKWGGRGSFGGLFLEGLKASAVFAGIFTVMHILFLILVPGYEAVILAHVKAQEQYSVMVNGPNPGYAFFRRIFLPILVFGRLIGSFMLGLFGSLIGAACAPKTLLPPQDF